jgi:hypothetical protein
MRITSVLGGVLLASAASGADLKQETLNAWDEYVRDAKSCMEERLHPDHQFLWVDQSPGRVRELRAGHIVVVPGGEQNPRRVPSGLIHHWIGAAFIPDARTDDVLAILRDYSRYKEVFHPTVIDSKATRQDGTDDQFSMVLMNKAVVMKMALDGDFQSHYVPAGPGRSYSVSQTTRVQEIENYAQPSERRLPADHGSGYIWRLFSITRLEERDGGIYIEVEAMGLSRDVPAALHWAVDPIIRRVSKGSLTTSLRQAQEAVATAGTGNQTARAR